MSNSDLAALAPADLPGVVPVKQSPTIGSRINGTVPFSVRDNDQNPCLISSTGKQWHAPKTAFRPTAKLTSYEKRAAQRQALSATKAKEKEMKDEKEVERQRRIQAIKDKRATKEEKARYEKMAEKMHKKRVERVKRREKRNKMLKS
ncbi:MAG: hypothetical protein MMC33_005847 [Icmadophila ericetorum]|nr:hypothetical protein [Icmadophila ericetorum]